MSGERGHIDLTHPVRAGNEPINYYLFTINHNVQFLKSNGFKVLYTNPINPNQKTSRSKRTGRFSIINC